MTSLGVEAKVFMDKGLLVPDELTVSMLLNRLKEEDCAGGYLLDGFPRTIAQADALSEAGEAVDAVLNMDVDYSLLTARITGRRMCAECGASYHVANAPPKKEGICDICGSQLYQRDDDEAQTVIKRLDEYDEKTKPLIEYYHKSGLVESVNANGEIEEVTGQIFAILDRFAVGK
jgi:adenylate kinase